MATTYTLSPSQAAALALINKQGVLYSGNGVSITTVRRLSDLGLINLTAKILTWNTRSTNRNHSITDWAATPKGN